MPDLAVSLAVPARNEERSVRELLEGLTQLPDLPAEIVVCDAGSTDGTQAVVGEFSDLGVRLVKAGPAYPGRARNLAAQVATQAWVAFVDCGCVPEADWLRCLIATRDANAGVDVVYGDYDPVVHTEWDAAQALVLLSPRDPSTGCRPPTTAGMLIRRDLFLELGGFPEHLRAAEDLFFFRAIALSGARTVRAPGARVRWSLAPSPAATFRRLRLYSAHHAKSGLASTWHHRVLGMDAIAVGLGLAGFYWPALWALLGLGAAARLARTVLSRLPSAPPEARVLTTGRCLRAAALLAVADAACVLGYFDYLRGRVATSPQ